MELILLAVIFGTAAGSFGIKWGIISYVEKYEEKIKCELDRINYKLTDDFLHSLNYRFLLETIYPEFRENMRMPLSCISTSIKVLRKYRPFNIKKTFAYFNQKGLIAPMTEEEIAEKEARKRKELEEKNRKVRKKQEITENLDRIYSKEQIATRELSTEEMKEQLKLTKELDNSDVSLVLKIQTLLVKLKKVNPEGYEKLNLEYKQLASEGKLDGFMLKDFLARLLCTLEYEVRDASTLINYLDSLIATYDNKKDFSLNDLEELTQNVINNSNIYSKEDKLIIYKKLSLLYLYFIYENKDSITKDMLEKSYFNHRVFLYATILNIDDLRKSNLIEDNLLFDINETYDLESVVNLIKRINFIKKEEIPKVKVLEI